MHLVSLRNANCRFWSHYSVSRTENLLIFLSIQLSLRTAGKKYQKKTRLRVPLSLLVHKKVALTHIPDPEEKKRHKNEPFLSIELAVIRTRLILNRNEGLRAALTV